MIVSEVFERVLTREPGCRTASLTLISPCCEARTDVPRDHILGQIKLGAAMPVWCGRKYSTHYRLKSRKGCDWMYKVTFLVAEDGVITAFWTA